MHPTPSTPFCPGERLLPLPEVRQLVPLSRSAIYQKMAAGEFPAKIRLSPGRVAWRERDILAWLDTRAGITPAAAPEAAR